MENTIIILVIAVLVLIGVVSTVKHFQGKNSCCGGGSTYISKKKLDNVIGKKTAIVDGLAAKVNLRKKEVVVSMAKEVDDETIRAAIEKAGYRVVEIR